MFACNAWSASSETGYNCLILFMMFFIGEEFIILFTNLHNFINS
ncbi:putative membrane protein [Bacteroides fragilis str. 1007-1-F |nr:putative membrane protein [Bacteroides fragilis str. 1007-1-F \